MKDLLEDLKKLIVSNIEDKNKIAELLIRDYIDRNPPKHTIYRQDARTMVPGCKTHLSHQRNKKE